MKITVIEPQTPEEFKQYYNLRFEILRKPWGQPKSSERENDDEISHHRMIMKLRGIQLQWAGCSIIRKRKHRFDIWLLQTIIRVRDWEVKL